MDGTFILEILEKYRHGASGISLALTPLTIYAVLRTAYSFRHELISFFKGVRTPEIVIGFAVVLHMTTSGSDNAYWFIPWSLHHIGSDHAAAWFVNGVYANIPFRQLGTTLAAYYYLLAIELRNKGDGSNIRWQLSAALLVGVMYVLLLDVIWL